LRKKPFWGTECADQKGAKARIVAGPTISEPGLVEIKRGIGGGMKDR